MTAWLRLWNQRSLIQQDALRPAGCHLRAEE